MKNVLDTAELKGMKKGMEQGMKKGMEQGMKKGMEQGMEKGIEQGASDERKKNAKAMKTLGLPLEAIAKVTGMPIDDIEKL
jgi:predicted transposase/invertase (TIGR01784 family)